MLTEKEYRAYKARSDADIAWSKQFRQKDGWIVITPEENAKRPENAKITNDERSAIEVYEFVTDPPDRYLVYIDEKMHNATTWTGMFLGKVSFGREYRDSFGGRRIPITVVAINGKLYHGEYYKSAGDYAKIRLAKNQYGRGRR